MARRLEEQARAELAAAADQIRQGLIANAADKATLEGTPTQAQVLAVVRRMLNREEQVLKGLRALARWED
jgi:hypothetical protein